MTARKPKGCAEWVGAIIGEQIGRLLALWIGLHIFGVHTAIHWFGLHGS
jgi:hypothetical protein